MACNQRVGELPGQLCKKSDLKAPAFYLLEGVIYPQLLKNTNRGVWDPSLCVPVVQIQCHNIANILSCEAML